MDDDDVRPEQLIPAGDLLAQRQAVMGYELEVQVGNAHARIALARSCLAHVAPAASEAEIAALDRVENDGAVDLLCRREAERGTFDPSYILYSTGKLMLLKLREDYQTRLGAKYSLRTFHDTLLANGSVPLWLHRKLMLGEETGALIE